MTKERDYFGGLGVDGRITLRWFVVSMYQPHETCHNTITAQGTMKRHSTTLEGSYCVYPSFFILYNPLCCTGYKIVIYAIDTTNYIILYHVILYYIILYYIMSYYIVLYYIISYYIIILYYILYYIIFPYMFRPTISSSSSHTHT